jgi:hypothetical protein
MNRDDRLFVIIGGSVVTAAAGTFLLFAGGITGSVERGPEIRVTPIPAAEARRSTEAVAAPDGVIAPTDPPAVVHAANGGNAPSEGGKAIASIVSGISSHPQWAAWLVTDDLLYRFVAAVEAVADGYSPAEELGFMAGDGPFLVRKDEDRLVIAAGTYRRYSLAVDVLTSIDVDDAVAVFRRLEPEIEEVRAEVAWHRGDFEDRLRQAVDHLLAVDVPSEPLAVERRTVSYAFADDRYERLSGAQRQLLRMGRANAEAVQAQLRKLRAAFDWPDEPPAPVSAPHASAPVTIADLAVGAPMTEPSTEVGAISEAVEPMVSPLDPRVAGRSTVWIESMPLMSAPTETTAP